MMEICSVCQEEECDYFCQNTLNYCDFYVCGYCYDSAKSNNCNGTIIANNCNGTIIALDKNNIEDEFFDN